MRFSRSATKGETCGFRQRSSLLLLARRKFAQSECRRTRRLTLRPERLSPPRCCPPAVPALSIQIVSLRSAAVKAVSGSDATPPPVARRRCVSETAASASGPAVYEFRPNDPSRGRTRRDRRRLARGSGRSGDRKARVHILGVVNSTEVNELAWRWWLLLPRWCNASPSSSITAPPTRSYCWHRATASSRSPEGMNVSNSLSNL